METTVGNSQTTELTPNSNCRAAGKGDKNKMTTIQFMSPQNGVVWYTTTVSTSAPTTKSMADVGSALVKFLKGLTVTLLGTGEGGDYNVVMSGKIRDNNAEYTFDNHVIYMSTGAPLNSPLFEIIND